MGEKKEKKERSDIRNVSKVRVVAFHNLCRTTDGGKKTQNK